MSAVVSMPAKPTMVTPEPWAALPDCLTERQQWVCWTYEYRAPKWTKLPRQPSRAAAKSDTPSTWSTFADVMAAVGRCPDLGIGFVFVPDDPFIGVDLDDCLTPDGALTSWAVPIMERFATPTRRYPRPGEESRSGPGHRWPELISGTGTRRPCGDGQVEIYQHGRFFTVTGRRYATAPLAVAEHGGDLEWLLAHIGAPRAACAATGVIPAAVPEKVVPPEPAREVTVEEQGMLRAKLDAARANVPKFDELWLGGACGYYAGGKPHPSLADLAFCNFLAYHLQLDAASIDQAFRMSERMRPKWDEQHFADGRTYGQATIQKALQWAAQERQRSVMGKVVPMPAASTNGSTTADPNAMPVFADVGLVWEKFEMSSDLIFGYAAGQRVK